MKDWSVGDSVYWYTSKFLPTYSVPIYNIHKGRVTKVELDGVWINDNKFEFFWAIDKSKENLLKMLEKKQLNNYRRNE